jgi:hypothetical protein
VPSRIWLGLPDPEDPKTTDEMFTEALMAMDDVDITGLATLEGEDLGT